MSLYLVELLVRLGVAVIADGTIKPRWYGSDQAKVCKRVQIVKSSRRLTPAGYYKLRMYVTGSNHQAQLYHRAASIAVIKRLLA